LNEQLKAAKMEDLPEEARDVLVLGYLGQTPRQIKRVINDLIAFRALAAEAEKANLIELGTLTGDLLLLTKVSVISVQWPEFLNQLGKDPELWVETVDSINSGAKIENVPPELVRFLAATRHVSPSSDVRPFVFLKRFDFERDIKLSTTVEDFLRKGERVEFQKLIEGEVPPARQQVIVAKTTTLGRQWLSRKRDTFLKNAAPIFARAALRFPDQHQLRLLALDVLEYLASVLKPDHLEEVVDVEDVMRLDENGADSAKEECHLEARWPLRPELSVDGAKTENLASDRTEQLAVGSIAKIIDCRICHETIFGRRGRGAGIASDSRLERRSAAGVRMGRGAGTPEQNCCQPRFLRIRD
jgi:hypothetical protein